MIDGNEDDEDANSKHQFMIDGYEDDEDKAWAILPWSSVDLAGDDCAICVYLIIKLYGERPFGWSSTVSFFRTWHQSNCLGVKRCGAARAREGK